MSLPAIVDDAQTGAIIYSGNQWSYQNHNSNYNRTITTCQGRTSSPPSLAFTFDGTGVALYGGPISNSAAFTYSVDNGTALQAIINSNAIGKAGANFWSVQGLTSGQHTLQVTPTAGQFSLDYLTYIPGSSTSTLSSNLILDDADKSVQFSGNWTKSAPSMQNGVPYQGTVTGSSTVGDTMKVQFVGSSVTVYGLLQQVSGKLSATFSVDGGQTSTYAPFGQDGNDDDDDDNPWLFSQQLYQQNLSPGTHTLLVTVTQTSGSQALWIDSMVFGSSPSNVVVTQPNNSGNGGNGDGGGNGGGTSSGDNGGGIGVNRNLSKSNSSGGMIAGIVVGLVALCVALLALYRRSRKRPFLPFYKEHGQDSLPMQEPPDEIRDWENNFTPIPPSQALASIGSQTHQYQFTPPPPEKEPMPVAGPSSLPAYPPAARQSKGWYELDKSPKEKEVSAEQQDGSDGNATLYSDDPRRSIKLSSPMSITSDVEGPESRQSHIHGSERISRSVERGSTLVNLTFQSTSGTRSCIPQETHPMLSHRNDEPPPYNPYNDFQ
ncbi:hypothetical protein JR316_0001293 [Psilocybe cubensis]|uniref:Uncharacterized protein n=2 Tax=Psilocybe cubensis TaxID=181762 RepID=A0ACB8HHB1_PSICU|nr:hypothetical protein JR316_0001293 [Psilocybe cubensis]KAH9487224.1 hypothetical protein JR316_0001293 [Psilocybe cubensis]